MKTLLVSAVLAASISSAQTAIPNSDGATYRGAVNAAIATLKGKTDKVYDKQACVQQVVSGTNTPYIAFQTFGANPPTAVSETTTNTPQCVASFGTANDTTGSTVWDSFPLPATATSITPKLVWKAANGTTGASAWKLLWACVGSGDPLDPASLTTTAFATDAPGAGGARTVTATASAITLTSCGGKDFVFGVRRGTGDTLSAAPALGRVSFLLAQ